MSLLTNPVLVSVVVLCVLCLLKLNVLMSLIIAAMTGAVLGGISIPVGSVTISLSGLAVAALVGILMNAILPGKDYEFGANEQGDTAVVNFGSRAQK